MKRIFDAPLQTPLPDKVQLGEMCEWLAREFGCELGPGVLLDLRQSLDAIAGYDGFDVARPRFGEHRLARRRRAAPVYTGLADAPSGDDLWALAPLRLALVLHWSPQSRVRLVNPERCTTVLHNWRHREILSGRTIIEEELGALVTEHRWTEASQYAHDARRRGEFSSLGDWLGRIGSAIDQILRHIRDSFVDELRPGSNPDGYPLYETPSVDSEEGDQDLLLGLEPETEQDVDRLKIGQNQKQAIAQYGYEHRLAGKWSGISKEALLPAQARRIQSMAQTLINAGGGTQDYTRLGAYLALMVLYTGQRCDVILKALFGDQMSAIVKPELKLKIEKKRVALEVPVMAASKFARDAGESYDEDTHDSFSIYAPIKEWVKGFFSISKYCEKRGESVDQIAAKTKAAFEQLIVEWRRAVRNCSETCLRGALINAVFMINLDVPATQLLFHQSFDCSSAALAYYSTSQGRIQSTYDEALRRVFREPALASGPDSERRIGAPLASVAVARISGFGRSLAPKGIGKAQRVDALGRAHNGWVRYIAWWLFVVTGHRGSAEFERLQANALSPGAGVALFADKRSEPSGFRRLAFIPDRICDELYRYRQHLLALRERLIAHPHSDRSVSEAIEGAVDGSSALFFLIRVEDGHAVAHPFDLKALWRDMGFADLPINAARHALSSWLRRECPQLPAVWIEQHLGHLHGASSLGRDGCVSAIELQRVLDAPLSAFLDACGFRPSSRSRQRPDQQVWGGVNAMRLSLDLARLERRAFAHDRERQRELYGFDGVSAGLSIDAVLTQVIAEQVDGYRGPRRPPTDVALDGTAIRAMATRVLSLATPGQHVAVQKALKARLVWHRHEHGWRLVIPARLYRCHSAALDITVASLMAYERLKVLRESILGTFRRPVNDKLGVAALCIVVWGHVTDTDVLLQVLRALPLAQWSSVQGDTLFVPVELDETETTTVCLSGLACAAAIGLLRSGQLEHQLPKDLETLNQAIKSCMPKDSLPRGPGKQGVVKALCDLVRLARKLEAPGVVAAAESGAIVTRQLPVHSLLSWLGNRNHPVQMAFTTNSGNSSTLVATRDAAYRQERYAYATLLCALHNLPKFYRRIGLADHPVARKISPSVIYEAMTTWIDKADTNITPVVELMARWAKYLATPGANLRHPTEPLRPRSIQTYLSRVKAPLLEALSGMPLDDLDEEWLARLLDGAIREDDRKHTEVVQCLNRMFHDLRKSLDLPYVILTSGVSSTPDQALIDAAVVPDAASWSAIAMLQHAANRPNRAISWNRQMADEASLLTLCAQTGLRRTEALYLHADDIEGCEAQVLIHLRARRRRLKSHAARRVRAVWRGLLPIALGEDDSRWLFPALVSNKSGEGHSRPLAHAADALQCATGGPKARLHHLRHTAGTRGIGAAFADKDITRRLLKYHRASVDMGHASGSTTVTHYVHVMQYLGAAYYAFDDAPYDVLGHLVAAGAKSEGAALRQRSSRVHRGVIRSAPLFTALWSTGKWDGDDKAAPRAIPVTDMPRTPGLTMAGLVEILFVLARGASIHELLGSLPCRSHDLTRIYEVIAGLAHQLGWSPINGECLQQLLRPSVMARGDNLHYPAIKVLKKAVNVWRCTIEIGHLDPIMNSLESSLIGFDWKSRDCVCAVRDEAVALKLQTCLKSVRAPLAMQFDANEKNVIFRLQEKCDSSRQSTTIRFILFALLVAALLNN